MDNFTEGCPKYDYPLSIINYKLSIIIFPKNGRFLPKNENLEPPTTDPSNFANDSTQLFSTVHKI